MITLDNKTNNKQMDFTTKDIEIIDDLTKELTKNNQTKELISIKQAKSQPLNVKLCKAVSNKLKKLTQKKRKRSKTAYIVVEENLSLTEKSIDGDHSSTAGKTRFVNHVFGTKNEAFNWLKEKYENKWLIGKKTCRSLTIDDREIDEDKQEVHLRKSFWSYYPNPSPIPSAWYKYSIEEIKGIDDIDKHNARQFEIAKKYIETMKEKQKSDPILKNFDFGSLEEYMSNY